MRYFISLISFIFIFSSCKDNSENNLTVYRVAEEGMQQSKKNISTATALLYNRFTERTKDYQSHISAIQWHTKAIEVKELSDSMINYISGLKEELKNEAGGGPGNKDWENNSTVTNHVFESHGRGKELLEKLVKYKQAVLLVDPILKNWAENKVNIFSNGLNFSTADTNTFIRTFFGKIPVIAANLTLDKFENNIKIIENEIVTFCFNQISDHHGNLDKYGFLIGQSSTYLKAGEILEINAGMGAYTTRSNPKITINGKNVSLDNEPFGVYKFKTPSKAGKYYVPIKIEYVTVNGKKELFSTTISYTIAE